MSKAQRMRDQRKDLYTIDPKQDPFLKSLQSQTGIPNYINIHKFLECRAFELKHFNNVLKTKLTSKLEH